ncbi:hypothetical protein KIW84_045453 [Lathyrus oleraceus]|uniref:Uncharacterized protein n=1 Tax=Pisum sativum TaxID=3888 RepID=A0A9D4XJ30_PEA|nr:hypothetical protein KIW84_045453 [Pisum sativum]
MHTRTSNARKQNRKIHIRVIGSFPKLPASDFGQLVNDNLQIAHYNSAQDDFGTEMEISTRTCLEPGGDGYRVLVVVKQWSECPPRALVGNGKMTGRIRISGKPDDQENIETQAEAQTDTEVKAQNEL